MWSEEEAKRQKVSRLKVSQFLEFRPKLYDNIRNGQFQRVNDEGSRLAAVYLLKRHSTDRPTYYMQYGYTYISENNVGNKLFYPLWLIHLLQRTANTFHASFND